VGLVAPASHLACSLVSKSTCNLTGAFAADRKDDEERRKEDRILEAAEAKKQAARAAARAKQRKEERIKAAAAAEARKIKEAKEREEIRKMRTGKAETSKLTSGPHSIHANARAGRRSRHAAQGPGKSSPSGVHGEAKPPQHGGVTANAKEALHLKADEAKDKTIVVPAKDLGLHSRGDADDGSMTMVAASMLCICTFRFFRLHPSIHLSSSSFPSPGTSLSMMSPQLDGSLLGCLAAEHRLGALCLTQLLWERMRMRERGREGERVCVCVSKGQGLLTRVLSQSLGS